MGFVALAIEDGILQELADLPDSAALVRIALRLLFAAALGGMLGFERERLGKEAGLRTHMLVALGAALFMVLGQQLASSSADLSRVIQGVVVGIGFLGSGAILKLREDHRIEGLTTAAGIWFTAAVGMTVGSGRIVTALVGSILAFLILVALRPIESRMRASVARDGQNHEQHADVQQAFHQIGSKN